MLDFAFGRASGTSLGKGKTMAEQIHISEQDASGGKKLGVMRYVLTISLALAIIAMTLMWLIGYQA
jgi:hypothetical protein